LAKQGCLKKERREKKKKIGKEEKSEGDRADPIRVSEVMVY
jgi:hypothetical protein